MRSGRAVVGAGIDYLSHPLPSQTYNETSDDNVVAWTTNWSGPNITANQQQVLYNLDSIGQADRTIQSKRSSTRRNYRRRREQEAAGRQEPVINVKGHNKLIHLDFPISRCCNCCPTTNRRRHKSESSVDTKEDYDPDFGRFQIIEPFRHQSHCPLQRHTATIEREAQSTGCLKGRSLSQKDYNQHDSEGEYSGENHCISLPALFLEKGEKISNIAEEERFEENDDPRLSRSLEDLPHDIRDHILRCQCSCDHLGYGNYSATSLDRLPNRTWQTSSGSSKSGIVWGGDKTEPLIKYKQREMEIKTHVWGAVCLVLFLAGVAGVGVSLPLALNTETLNNHSNNNINMSADLDERLQEAKELLSQTPLIDGHNDLPWNIRKFMHNRLHSFNMSADLSNLRPWSKSSWSHTDLPRMRLGHVGAQFWVSYVPCESQYLNAVQLTIEQIDLIKRLIDQYPNDLRLATSAADVEASFRDGHIASLIGVEGGHAMQNSLGVLRALHELGVRYLTLTHTCSTPWAESAGNKESTTPGPDSPKGLTHFGKIVVKEMNRLGILVDLSHASQATMRAAILTSRAPVLFSHSSVYALCKNPRNVPDDILRKVATNKGLVMVSFYNQFLTCGGTATIKDVIRHINHVRKVAGVDHVGIGADFDGINKLPKGLEDVSKYPHLFAELKKDSSWSDGDLKKLAGLNILRVLRDVEKEAIRQKKQLQRPYEDDIPPSQLKGKLDCALKFLNDDRS